MNRRISSGAWGLFRAHPTGTRVGNVVWVRSAMVEDPETGEYTLKRYAESGKVPREDGTLWDYRALLRAFQENANHPPVLIQELDRAVSALERLAATDAE